MSESTWNGGKDGGEYKRALQQALSRRATAANPSWAYLSSGFVSFIVLYRPPGGGPLWFRP